MPTTYSEADLYQLIANKLADFSDIIPLRHREVESALVKTMFELFQDAADLNFDWNRPISSLPSKGQNLFNETGATTLAEGIEALYFQYLASTLSLDNPQTQIVGIHNDVEISGTISINHSDEVVNEVRFYNNGTNTLLDTQNPVNNGQDILISYLWPNVTSNKVVRVEVDLDNNGSPITINQLVNIEFQYPIIFGYNVNPTLSFPMSDLSYKVKENLQEFLLSNQGYFHIYVPVEYDSNTKITFNGLRLTKVELESTNIALSTNNLNSNWTHSYTKYILPEQYVESILNLILEIG